MLAVTFLNGKTGSLPGKPPLNGRPDIARVNYAFHLASTGYSIATGWDRRGARNFLELLSVTSDPITKEPQPIAALTRRSFGEIERKSSCFAGIESDTLTLSAREPSLHKYAFLFDVGRRLHFSVRSPI